MWVLDKIVYFVSDIKTVEDPGGHFSVKIMPLIDEHPPLDLAPPPSRKILNPLLTNNYNRSNSLAESCKSSLPTKKTDPSLQQLSHKFYRSRNNTKIPF